uniref:Chitin-binding type-2 domain-containing protein n=1 Tax=Strigamia maritima TaxID=126957 RepID=T1IK90_STRMM
MKINQIVIAAVFLIITAIMAHPKIVKRQADTFRYVLPAGAEILVGSVKTSFNCEGRNCGYYADVDNNCQIFHICFPAEHASGLRENYHYSFLCPNQTIFDQSQLICDTETFENPCGQTSEWIYLNQFFNLENKQFFPRKAIPDGRPQGNAASAPNFVRAGKKNFCVAENPQY